MRGPNNRISHHHVYWSLGFRHHVWGCTGWLCLLFMLFIFHFSYFYYFSFFSIFVILFQSSYSCNIHVTLRNLSTVFECFWGVLQSVLEISRILRIEMNLDGPRLNMTESRWTQTESRWTNVPAQNSCQERRNFALDLDECNFWCQEGAAKTRFLNFSERGLFFGIFWECVPSDRTGRSLDVIGEIWTNLVFHPSTF